MGTDRNVAILLRIEAAAIAAMVLFFFSVSSGDWLLFALLFLLPDLSMLGYLAGPRIGAIVYNLAHIYAAPVAIGAAGWFGNAGILVTLALVWMAHIAIDRALGLGLKTSRGFWQTHLGPIGRPGHRMSGVAPKQ